MTPRIPLSRCKRCKHYRRETCQLPDLEPCNFEETEESKDSRFRTRYGIINTAIVAVLIVLILLLNGCAPRKPEPHYIPHFTTMELLHMQHPDELTPWQELQLAIMMTESKFTAEAVGAAGDRGILQLVPSYVAEANRLAGTSYTPEDAHDIGKALEMFAIVQGAYNPDHDIEAGIYHHNKGRSYKAAVLNNLDLVRRYEAARKAVTR